MTLFESQQAILPPVDEEMFWNSQLSSFDVFYKRVTDIPYNPDLVQNITRAKFVNCYLDRVPPGLSEYTYVTHLDLCENKIESLEWDSFSNFIQLQTLDLSSNMLKSLDIYLPDTLVTLDVSYNNGFDMKSIWNKNLPQLCILKATHCQIAQLPEETPAFSENLKSIFLDGNLLTEFPPALNNFSSLEEVSLFGNLLTSFDHNVTQQKFKSININFNKLENFDVGSGLTAQTVNLSSNLFSTFPTSALLITELRVLTLIKCGLQGVLDIELPPQFLGLDISHNKVTGFSDRFIQSMKGIQAINISYNNIEELQDCFPEDLRLTRLFGDQNKITSLPNSLMQAKHIEIFSMSNNRITQLSNFSLPRLRQFNVSFNELTEIPDCFGNCAILSEFNCSFNHLQDLPSSLAQCKKMTSVIAVSNDFIKVPKCILSFSTLKTLILSGNKLTLLPVGLGSFFFLKTLDVSNNHLVEMPQMIAKLRALKFLNLSHNAISTIPESFDFPIGITLLDISYNKLESIALNLPKLTSLNLDYNLLTEFDFTPLQNCHFLSLSNNKFTEPLISKLPALIQMENLRCFEYIGNEKNPIDVPPIRFHILDDSKAKFCDHFGVGYSATLGERPTMEDSVAFQVYDDKHSLFGVFDGHTGGVASACSVNCIMNESVKLVQLPDEDIGPAFAQCFANVNHKLELIGVNDGCTAACAFFSGKRCFVAGVGDSRIVRVKRESCERITTDYKPMNRSEFERLRQCGFNVNTEGRINRKLAVARSLGDFWIGEGGLFVIPDIRIFDIDEDDIGLIIACDGLWDMVTDEWAANIVRSCVNAADAAVTLRNYAFALGSKDNISVICIRFNATGEDLGLCNRNTVEILPIVEDDNDDCELCLPVANDLGGRRRRH